MSTTNLSDIQKLTAEFAELVERGKTMFSEISQSLFDKHPNLESFGWRQYTMYFNDGETCYFSVYADRDWGLYINGESTDELENVQRETYQATGNKVMQKQYDWQSREYKEVEVDEKKFLPNPNYDPVMGDMVNDVADLITSMPTDVMEDMFGDHAEVTVSRTGIQIDEYTDHD